MFHECYLALFTYDFRAPNEPEKATDMVIKYICSASYTRGGHDPMKVRFVAWLAVYQKLLPAEI